MSDMSLSDLTTRLQRMQSEGRAPVDARVRLVVEGVAYPLEDAWWEPQQGGDGAVCIGIDPR